MSPDTEITRLGAKLARDNTQDFVTFEGAIEEAEMYAEKLGLSPRRLAIVRRNLEDALIHAFAGQNENKKEPNDAG